MGKFTFNEGYSLNDGYNLKDGIDDPDYNIALDSYKRKLLNNKEQEKAARLEARRVTVTDGDGLRDVENDRDYRLQGGKGVGLNGEVVDIGLNAFEVKHQTDAQINADVIDGNNSAYRRLEKQLKYEADRRNVDVQDLVDDYSNQGTSLPDYLNELLGNKSQTTTSIGDATLNSLADSLDNGFADVQEFFGIQDKGYGDKIEKANSDLRLKQAKDSSRYGAVYEQGELAKKRLIQILQNSSVPLPEGAEPLKEGEYYTNLEFTGKEDKKYDRDFVNILNQDKSQYAVKGSLLNSPETNVRFWKGSNNEASNVYLKAKEEVYAKADEKSGGTGVIERIKDAGLSAINGVREAAQGALEKSGTYGKLTSNATYIPTSYEEEWKQLTEKTLTSGATKESIKRIAEIKDELDWATTASLIQAEETDTLTDKQVALITNNRESYEGDKAKYLAFQSWEQLFRNQRRQTSEYTRDAVTTSSDIKANEMYDLNGSMTDFITSNIGGVAVMAGDSLSYIVPYVGTARFMNTISDQYRKELGRELTSNEEALVAGMSMFLNATNKIPLDKAVKNGVAISYFAAKNGLSKAQKRILTKTVEKVNKPTRMNKALADVTNSKFWKSQATQTIAKTIGGTTALTYKVAQVSALEGVQETFELLMQDGLKYELDQSKMFGEGKSKEYEKAFEFGLVVSPMMTAQVAGLNAARNLADVVEGKFKTYLNTDYIKPERLGLDIGKHSNSFDTNYERLKVLATEKGKLEEELLDLNDLESSKGLSFEEYGDRASVQNKIDALGIKITKTKLKLNKLSNEALVAYDSVKSNKTLVQPNKELKNILLKFYAYNNANRIEENKAITNEEMYISLFEKLANPAYTEENDSDVKEVNDLTQQNLQDLELPKHPQVLEFIRDRVLNNDAQAFDSPEGFTPALFKAALDYLENTDPKEYKKLQKQLKQRGEEAQVRHNIFNGIGTDRYGKRSLLEYSAVFRSDKVSNEYKEEAKQELLAWSNSHKNKLAGMMKLLSSHTEGKFIGMIAQNHSNNSSKEPEYKIYTDYASYAKDKKRLGTNAYSFDLGAKQNKDMAVYFAKKFDSEYRAITDMYNHNSERANVPVDSRIDFTSYEPEVKKESEVDTNNSKEVTDKDESTPVTETSKEEATNDTRKTEKPVKQDSTDPKTSNKESTYKERLENYYNTIKNGLLKYYPTLKVDLSFDDSKYNVDGKDYYYAVYDHDSGVISIDSNYAIAVSNDNVGHTVKETVFHELVHALEYQKLIDNPYTNEDLSTNFKSLGALIKEFKKADKESHLFKYLNQIIGDNSKYHGSSHGMEIFAQLSAWYMYNPETFKKQLSNEYTKIEKIYANIATKKESNPKGNKESKRLGKENTPKEPKSSEQQTEPEVAQEESKQQELDFEETTPKKEEPKTNEEVIAERVSPVARPTTSSTRDKVVNKVLELFTTVRHIGASLPYNSKENFTYAWNTLFTSKKSQDDIQVDEEANSAYKSFKEVPKGVYSTIYNAIVNGIPHSRNNTNNGLDRNGNALSFALLDDLLMLGMEVGNKFIPENKAALVELLTDLAVETLQNDLQDTLYNDEEAINSFLHVAEGTPIPSILSSKVATLGTKRDVLASSIGKKFTSILGVKLNKDSEKHLPQGLQKLQLAVGNRILYSLVDSGLLENISTPSDSLILKNVNGNNNTIINKESTVNTVRLKTTSPTGFKPTVKVTKVLKAVATDNLRRYFIDVHNNIRKSNVSFKPIKKAATKVKNTLLSISPKIEKFLIQQQSQKWVFNDNAQNISDLSDSMLKDISGYREENSIQENNKENAEGKNLGVTKEINNLRFYYDNFKNEGFFFRFVMWSSGRFGMNCIDFSPQASKLQRHTLVLEGNATSILVGDNKTVDTFKVALALAFGNKDFTSYEEARAFIDKEILSKDVVKEAIKIIQEHKAGTKFTAIEEAIIKEVVDLGGEAWYTMEALTALAGYKKAERDGVDKFTTTFSAEVDGITNGVILALLQVPQHSEGKFNKAAGRGGVFLDNEYSDNGEFRATGALDTYVNSVAGMKEESINTPVNALFPFTDSKGKTSKFWRNLVKNPLMILNYGAGLGKIANAIGEGMLQHIWDTLEDPKLTEEQFSSLKDNLIRAINYGASVDYNLSDQGSLLIDGFEADFLINIISTELTYDNRLNFSFGNENNLEQRDYANSLLVKLFKTTHGKPFTTFLKKEFKQQLKNKDLLIEIMDKQQRLFMEVYATEVVNFREQLGKQSDELLSISEMDQFLESMIPFLPAITRPEDGEQLLQGVKSTYAAYYNDINSKMRDVSTKNKAMEYRTKVSPKGASHNDTSGLHSGRIREVVFMEANVATLVKAVHTLDSSILQATLTKFKGLIIHDATIFSLKDLVGGTNYFNKKVYDHSKNTYFGRNMLDRLETIEKNVESWVTSKTDDPKIAKEEFESIQNRLHHNFLTAKFGRVMYGKSPDVFFKNIKEGAKWEGVNGNFYKDYNDWSLSVEYSVSNTEEHRAYMFSRMTSIHQIALPIEGANYSPNQQELSEVSADYSIIPTIESIALLEKMYGEFSEVTEDSLVTGLVDSVNKKLNLDSNEQVTLHLSKSDEKQLRTLKGVGVKKAERIANDINSRNEPVDQLSDIDGLTQHTIDKNKAEGTDVKWNSPPDAKLSFEDAAKHVLDGSNVVKLGNQISKQDTAINGKTISKSHQNYLMKFLSTLATNVLNKSGDPIAVGISNNIGITGGNASPQNRQVKINLGNYRKLNQHQSGLEVYAHELTHILTGHAADSDPKFQKDIDALFDLAFKHLESKKYPYEIFLNRDSEGNIVYENSLKEEVKNAKARYDHIMSSETYRHEFLAYTLTNEAFMNEMKELKIKTPEFDGSVLGFIQKLIYTMQKVLNEVFYRAKKDNVFDEVTSLVEDLHGLNTYNSDIIAIPFAYLQAGRAEVAKRIRKTAKTVLGSVGVKLPDKVDLKQTFDYVKGNKFIKPVVNLVATNETMRKITRKFFDKEGFLYNLVAQEIGGGSKFFKELIPQLLKSNNDIDKHQADVTSLIKDTVSDVMPEEVTEEEKSFITDLLIKNDLQVLGMSSSDMLKLIYDNKTLIKTIKDKEAELFKSKGWSKVDKFITSQIKGFAKYNATGDVYLKGEQLLDMRQASTMASKVHSDVSFTPSQTQLMRELVSLYGIKYSSKEAKASVYKTYKQSLKEHPNKDMLGTIVSLHKKINDSLPIDVQQGYTKESFSPSAHFVVRKYSDKELLEEAGYKLVERLPSHKGEILAIFRNDLDKNTDYSRGIYSFTRKTVGRFNYNKVMQDISGEVSHKEGMSEAHADSLALINYMIKGNKGFISDTPVTSTVSVGIGSQKQFVVSREVRNNALSENTDVVEVLGRLAGYGANLTASKEVNANLMQSLSDDYADNYTQEDKENWLDISKEDIDLYRLLGKEVPKKVRKDILKLAFGYRKLSVKQSKLLSKMNTPVHLRAKARAFELIWGEVAKVGAVNIVLKTPQVIFGNLQSNLNLLFVDGISPVKAVKDFYEAHKLVKRFKDDKRALAEIDIELHNTSDKLSKGALRKIEARRRQYTERIDTNPIKPLIDKGVFQSITEDINVNNYSSSYLENTKIAKSLNKDMPSTVKTLINNLFITKETLPFKLFMQLTQESDFWARWSAYKHRVKKGINIDEAIADVMEDYIVYDLPSSPELQYMNDQGLMRFTKFLLRSQRVELKKVINNFDNVVINLTLQHLFGDTEDMFDNNILFTDKVLNRVDDPLSPETVITDVAILPINNIIGGFF